MNTPAPPFLCLLLSNQCRYDTTGLMDSPCQWFLISLGGFCFAGKALSVGLDGGVNVVYASKRNKWPWKEITNLRMCFRGLFCNNYGQGCFFLVYFSFSQNRHIFIGCLSVRFLLSYCRTIWASLLFNRDGHLPCLSHAAMGVLSLLQEVSVNFGLLILKRSCYSTR